ncbi:MAG: hypothetical protein QM653_02725 [Dysgonomonas sp.]|uniref:terminase gpP N-terminus-related DNA-binding protein n=1 Tax=Dysgonomonas sp. TaxID=1891233 RepID=UPI0039E64D83
MAKRKDYKQLKRWAQDLFYQGLTQKEISKKIDVSETTISKWSIDNNWKTKKDNIILSKDDRLSELYEELKEHNKMIREKTGYKVANKAEADARRQLIKDIKDLETNYNIAETIQIGRDFTAYVKEIDFEIASTVLDLYDGFVNHTIEKQKWQK